MAKRNSFKKKSTTVKETKKNYEPSIKEAEQNGDKLSGSIPVVGIGASAGGLEAFKELLEELPDDTNMAFVFIQHLDPYHKSVLGELLSRSTTMKVIEVKDNTQIKPNEVYLISPNKLMQLKKGKLILTNREAKVNFNPVDFFFHSLAEEQKNRAIGIILSGTASDGTAGLRDIKAEGGLTFVQEIESAKFDGMPRSAIVSGSADFILHPKKIAHELIRIGKHPFMVFRKNEFENIEEESQLEQIFKRIYAATGVDFSLYKSSTIKRRISKRMVLHKAGKISDYIKILIENKSEIHELYKDLLINVTNFFRDPETFDTLKKKIFPQFVKKMSNKPIRIWVPGCSSGEEVYSIAISFLEFAQNKNINPNIQIFATDISDASIEVARTGFYPDSFLSNVSKTRLKNFFFKVNGGYQINKSIREMCIFAKQDITKDPPFSNIDLISCRNLLIYFSLDLQKKVIPIFHYALKAGGFLLLGGSESIGKFGDLFTLADKKIKLYLKKQADTRFTFDFNNVWKKDNTEDQKPLTHQQKNIQIQAEVDKLILNKFTPAGILINNNLDVIQFRGNVGKYIHPQSGIASLNLFKLLNENLFFDLNASIRKAGKMNEVVTVNNVRIDKDNKTEEVNIEIVPIKKSKDSKELYYLILFREIKSNEYNTSESLRKSKGKVSDKKYEELKKELIISKENMQAVIEEREATNEELRSALEELQSSNEELQSTNEELETAKEELQSTNEELITVNEEFENRNSELSELNNDLNNLLASVNIAIVMLDRRLRIRRFTPKAEKIWNLITSDIGRPLIDMNPKIKIPELKKIILNVIDSLETVDIDVQDAEGLWYSMRVRPYKTIENKIDGVVISLLDVNILKTGFISATNEKEYVNAVLNSLKEPIIILDKNLKVQTANKSYYDFFRANKDEIEGKFFHEINGGAWNSKKLIELLTTLIPDNPFEEYKYENTFPYLGKIKLTLSGRKVEQPGKETLFLVTIKKE